MLFGEFCPVYRAVDNQIREIPYMYARILPATPKYPVLFLKSEWNLVACFVRNGDVSSPFPSIFCLGNRGFITSLNGIGVLGTRLSLVLILSK